MVEVRPPPQAVGKGSSKKKQQEQAGKAAGAAQNSYAGNALGQTNNDQQPLKTLLGG